MDSATILVADDDTTSARFLQRLLTREGHEVRIVDTAEAVLSACEADPPDLVLIDLVARGHAFNVCRELKECEATCLIPIVIVTSQSESGERLKGIEAGADDFLNKPVKKEELLARVRSLVRLKRFTDELENAETVLCSLARSIEAKDPYTEGHCDRLSRYTVSLGERIVDIHGLQDACRKGNCVPLQMVGIACPVLFFMM